MTKKTTLEDFVKNYIQNQENSTAKSDYGRWVSENGIDSQKIYDDSIRDITSDYKKSKSEFGSLAESLSSLGLTASGYSDYLNGKAYYAMQKRKEGAKNTYVENERQNLKGYSEYISSLAKDAESNYKNVVNTIKNAGIADYDEAYNFAIAQGLSESSAELAARSASDTVKKKIRETALKTIIAENFSGSRALQYSLALGLPESEAQELAEYANKINRESYYSNDYIEYLKNKWAAESGK